MILVLGCASGLKGVQGALGVMKGDVRRIFRSAMTVPLCSQLMYAWVLLASNQPAARVYCALRTSRDHIIPTKNDCHGLHSRTAIAAKAGPGPQRYKSRSVGVWERLMLAPASPRTKAESVSVMLSGLSMHVDRGRGHAARPPRHVPTTMVLGVSARLSPGRDEYI